MTGLSMVLVLLLGQAPDRGAGSWCGTRLVAIRRAQAAAAALEKMGLDALPALRDGRESKDPELRNRAEAIIARTGARAGSAEAEGTRIGRPELKDASPIRLDVANRPLDEVIEGFGSPSPSRLAWHPTPPIPSCVFASRSASPGRCRSGRRSTGSARPATCGTSPDRRAGRAPTIRPSSACTSPPGPGRVRGRTPGRSGSSSSPSRTRRASTSSRIPSSEW